MNETELGVADRILWHFQYAQQSRAWSVWDQGGHLCWHGRQALRISGCGGRCELPCCPDEVAHALKNSRQLPHLLIDLCPRHATSAPRRSCHRLLTCQGDARRANELSVEARAGTRTSSCPAVRVQGSRLWHPEQVWQLRSARTHPSFAPPPNPARPWASPLRPGSPWRVGCGLQ